MTENDDESVINTNTHTYKVDISKYSISQNKVNNKFEPRNGRIKHKPHVSYEKLDIQNDYLMVTQSFICNIPSSVEEIKYRSDIGNKLLKMKYSLLINKIQILVPKPSDKNIADYKWVFAIKNDEFGKSMKYKARLVTRGFSQEYLVDFNEIFAPVARISSFRFIVAFAVQNNLFIHHMDFKIAFLNGTLREEIYMNVPEGVEYNKKFANY